MNQDKDNLLVLRVENDPPQKVEVKRVARPGEAVRLTEAEYNQRLQAMSARQQQLNMDAIRMKAAAMAAQQQGTAAYQAAVAAQQAAPFFGPGRGLFGGLG